jgi:hypothetical protein
MSSTWNTATDILELVKGTLRSVVTKDEVRSCQTCGCYFTSSEDDVGQVVFVDRWNIVHEPAHLCQCHALAGKWAMAKDASTAGQTQDSMRPMPTKIAQEK